MGGEDGEDLRFQNTDVEREFQIRDTGTVSLVTVYKGEAIVEEFRIQFWSVNSQLIVETLCIVLGRRKC